MNLTESQTLAFKSCSRVQVKRIDIIYLSLLEPDFDTPDFIKVAAKKAIDDNYTWYTPLPGYLDLRQAISEKFKELII